MVEPNNQQLATLGIQASQVLENPAFEEAFRRMRETIVSAWASADVRDTEGQRLLLQQMKLIDRVKGSLIGMIEGGKLANSKIKMDDLRGESATRRMLRKVL